MADSLKKFVNCSTVFILFWVMISLQTSGFNFIIFNGILSCEYSILCSLLNEFSLIINLINIL